MRILQVGSKPFRRADDQAELARRGVTRALAQAHQDPFICLSETPFDAVFIDLDDEIYQGKTLIGRIRRAKIEIPVFAFTQTNDLRFKIGILDFGADDVVTVLCPIDELLARVRAVLRRTERHMSSTLAYGPVEVDMAQRAITVNGEALHLSPNEYQLLELLVRKHGLPLNREACLAYLYAGRDAPEIKAIDVLICRLRKKLADRGAGYLIKNVWGHGFKLDLQPPADRRRDDAPGEVRKRARHDADELVSA